MAHNLPKVLTLKDPKLPYQLCLVQFLQQPDWKYSVIDVINTFYISIFNLVDTTILLIKKEFFIMYHIWLWKICKIKWNI